jgi:transposase
MKIPAGKIRRWYKNVLSGFTQEEEQKKLHRHDAIDKSIISKETGKAQKVLVPILKPENFGEDMAIDDKNIGGEGYTIISNKNTGKIACMIQTTKAKIITDILHTLPSAALFIVRTISKDLAEGYDWVARTVFLNAMRIADKFHVLKLGFEALQAIRIRYRQEILKQERDEREAYRQQECERRDQYKREGKKYKIKKRKTRTERHIHKNGETTKELLARSRYLLFKLKTQWTPTQAQRADILFQKFPEIKTAYNLITLFRDFYTTPIGKREKAKEKLKEWYDKVSKKNIEEILLFASTVQRHEGEILNYFEEGHTNAFAESLNSKIESFIHSNSGTRDRDFFHYRMKGYFS